VTVGSDKT